MSSKTKKPLHISATRVQLYDSCPRKWAAQYVKGWCGGDPQLLPSTGDLDFGTEMHRIAEYWLAEGTPPPNTLEGRTFLGGLDHWPAPKTKNLWAEREFNITIAGKPMSGTCDVVWMQPNGRLLVGDHKTTKNLYWAKTEFDLRQDRQAMTYAWAMMQEFGVEECDLKWVYYQKVTDMDEVPKSKAVEISVTLEEVKKVWEKTTKSAKNMVKLYKESPHPTDVPGHLEHCEAFGGCPYLENCNDLRKENKDMSKLSKMDKLTALANSKPQAAKAEVVPPEVKTEKPRAVETVTKGIKGTEKEKLKAAIAALHAIHDVSRQFEAVGKKILDDLAGDLGD